MVSSAGIYFPSWILQFETFVLFFQHYVLFFFLILFFFRRWYRRSVLIERNLCERDDARRVSLVENMPRHDCKESDIWRWDKRCEIMQSDHGWGSCSCLFALRLFSNLCTVQCAPGVKQRPLYRSHIKVYVHKVLS